MIEIRTFLNNFFFPWKQTKCLLSINDFVGARNGFHHLKCDLILKCLLIYFLEHYEENK